MFPQGSSTRPQRLVPRTCPQGRKFRLGQKGETLATLWNSESRNNFSFCFFGLQAPSALSCLRTLRSGAISPSMEKTWGHTRSKKTCSISFWITFEEGGSSSTLETCANQRFSCIPTECMTPSVTIMRCRVPLATHSFRISSRCAMSMWLYLAETIRFNITHRYDNTKTSPNPIVSSKKFFKFVCFFASVHFSSYFFSLLRACGAAPCTIWCHRWSRRDSTWPKMG